MEVIIYNNLMWLCISLAATFLTILLMHVQSHNFYTHDVVVRKFSIIDLQLPASAQDFVNIIKGIFKLPAEESKKSLKALKTQLYIDFFFMPAAYGTVFLLCIIVSSKMSRLGHWTFLVLAWMQVIAWLCDIIENIYLLRRLRPDITPDKPSSHKTYQAIELTKFGIAMTGTVCSVFGLLYFWLTGDYFFSSLHYLVIILSEIVLFIIAGKILYNRSK